MKSESNKLNMPRNPKKGDLITFVNKCPYECKVGTHTVVGQWNGKFWDYKKGLRHCKECGFLGTTIEAREWRKGDEWRDDPWIETVGQLLDGAKDASAREGTASYLKCIRALIPAELKPSSL